MALINYAQSQNNLSGKATFSSRTAHVNGVNIHYLKAGTGTTPLVLIHGFGDTSRMWIPLFQPFGKDYTMIAPDIRGLGDSSRPDSGYDKKTAAIDIRELVNCLGYERIALERV
jgi:pimeloyl-ACP methyl ester carboxylesterase